MLSGFATSAGTAEFSSRFPSHSAAGFYRSALGLTLSTLGLGTYLGGLDDATDAAYASAVRRALQGGINFIDTSLNSRHQRSERAIARALADWMEYDGGSRDQFAVCTKAGYLTPGAFPAGLAASDEVIAGMHCMAPRFLRDQLDRSRHNLNLAGIDVFYLHNPETQLAHIPAAAFYGRIRTAFELLETMVAANEIRFYGLATWDGFRRNDTPGALSIERLAAAARDCAGDAHHFRFVQLPVNLAMREGGRLLDLAPDLGITVVASASLLQGRLSRGLPDEVAGALPGLATDAQRAIQFARSTPGVTIALAGMSQVRHVEENLGVASVPPVRLPRAFA